jgi:hypothetical protein
MSSCRFSVAIQIDQARGEPLSVSAMIPLPAPGAIHENDTRVLPGQGRGSDTLLFPTFCFF